MLRPIYKVLSVLLLVILCTSCVSNKKVWYLHDIEEVALLSTKAKKEAIIQPNDLITINITSSNPEVVHPFNNTVMTASTQRSEGGGGGGQIQPYLVDEQGYIDFPVLGKLGVGGKGKSVVIEEIENKLSDLVKDARVSIRIVNYSVTVLGEVGSPGVISVDNERLTILDALGLAGDMTIFGDRQNIIVLREENGIKNHKSLDITSAEIINSDYYYLRQNDVVYVAPNNAQVQGSIFNRNTSVFVSIAGILISVVTLLIR